MRINIPSFRLPAHVLDEEIGYILDMGVDIRYNTPVDQHEARCSLEGYDAIFVGSGAPKGKDLDIPGRYDTDQIHIGIDWLESVHFGHIDTIEPRVLIIGVGNTAMDCCRTSKRLGGTDVKVIARRGRKHFKASPWELEDAEEEQVEIVENHAPKRFVLENGKLVGHGVRAARVDGRKRPRRRARVIENVDDPVRRGDSRDRPGERVPLDRARHRPRVRRVGHAGGRQDDVHVDAARRVLRRRCGVGPREHHLGGRARSPGGDLDSQPLQRHSAHRAPAVGHEPHEPEDGHPRVELQQRLQRGAAREDDARRADGALQAACAIEVETGLHARSRPPSKCSAASTATSQTHFTDALCIECDACIDICPVDCLTITYDSEPEGAGEGADSLIARLTAPRLHEDQPLFASGPLKQTARVMVKDEDVCLHCGLCAERCPTAAWDMRKFELMITYAGKEPQLVQLAGVRVMTPHTKDASRDIARPAVRYRARSRARSCASV